MVLTMPNISEALAIRLNKMIKKDSALLFTSGEYSDYQHLLEAVALKDFSFSEAVEAFAKEHKIPIKNDRLVACEYDDGIGELVVYYKGNLQSAFLEWLWLNKYIAEKELFTEIWIGGYGSLSVHQDGRYM